MLCCRAHEPVDTVKGTLHVADIRTLKPKGTPFCSTITVGITNGVCLEFGTALKMLARPNSSDECPHSRPICSLELDMKTTALLLLKAFDMCFYMDYNVTIWASTQYAVGWPSESSCNVADLTSHEWTMTSCTWCCCVIKLSHLLSRRAFWTMTWSPNAAR